MQELHQEVTLGLNADSTEFCPVEGLQNLLAVGTYELDETSQTRHGLLYLYKLLADPAEVKSSSANRWQLLLLHTLPISGIFDMRWHRNAPARLLAACADGQLHLLHHTQNSMDHQMQSTQQVHVAPGAMALSLDVSPTDDVVVTSSSTGSLCKLQVCLPNTNKYTNCFCYIIGCYFNHPNCVCCTMCV